MSGLWMPLLDALQGRVRARERLSMPVLCREGRQPKRGRETAESRGFHARVLRSPLIACHS